MRSKIRQIGQERRKRRENVQTLPDFLIIGAQKAGTSSLFNYLAQHPGVVPSYTKEVGFFSTTRYTRGLSWYQRQFPAGRPDQLYFEATPEYLYNPAVPERIYAYRPDIKLIVLLRDPYRRAYSGWNKYRVNHADPVWRRYIVRRAKRYEYPELRKQFLSWFNQRHYPSFRETVEQEIDIVEQGLKKVEPSVVQRGIYHLQLERYYRYFRPDQILILEDHQLRADPQGSLAWIFEFLGVGSTDLPLFDLKETNVRDYELDIEPEVAARLTAFYQPRNERLFELLDREFEWTRPQ